MGFPFMAQRSTNPTRIQEDVGSISALLSGLRADVAVSCGVGLRHGLDPKLLWLWCRLAAVALIGALAWELPCAVGAALKKKKREREKKDEEKVEGKGEEWAPGQMGRKYQQWQHCGIISLLFLLPLQNGMGAGTEQGWLAGHVIPGPWIQSNSSRDLVNFCLI